MPTLTFRLSAQERSELEHQAQVRGLALSDLVREALKLRGSGDPLADLETRVVEVERRLKGLEQLAGQDF